MNKRAVFSFAMLLISIIILSSSASPWPAPEHAAMISADNSNRVLLWNTFLGTSGGGRAESVATDAAGNIYVGGSASASWGVAVRPYSGGGDAFVAKIDGTGHFVWLTFLGGTGSDSDCSIAVDQAGGIFVAGKSSASWGVPVRPWSGAIDAFVAKIAPDGSLLWNTFLGSTSDDEARGIIVDGTGKTIVVGQSAGPSWGTPLRPREGNTDVFVAILNSQGVLETNTFLGGIGEDSASGIARGADGNLYVVGSSGATWGAPVIGSTGLFVAKLTPGVDLVWNTFPRNARSYAIAVNGAGEAFIGGSNGYYIKSYGEITSGFVLALSSSGAVRWQADLGGGYNVELSNILLDKEGNIFAGLGATDLSSYGHISVISKFSPAGSILWKEELGSSGQASIRNYVYLRGLALDEEGKIDAVGYSKQTWGNPINPFTGSEDAFVAEIAERFITLSAPNGGEFWAVGTSQNVKWSTEATIPNIKLEYSTNNGLTWTVITSSSPNDGSYDWQVPNESSSQCLIRISDASNPDFADQNDAPFSIVVSTSPVIGLTPGELRFGTSGGTTTSPLSLLINNMGGGALSWTAASDCQWLVLDPVAGSGPGQIAVRAVPGGLPSGSYEAHIAITASGALNSPKSIKVFLNVYSDGAAQPPFGYFDRPRSGATVSSSIPVAGWALDDIETTSVKIFRDPVGNEPAGQRIYIGDANFVEGARPDIELAYPSYPLNSRAGWGYMMLTNFLPNGGNGAVTLYAYAIDKEGREVSLGSKLITCDNAHAVKPFGAIDTPGQGGAASGSGYFNFGWALTPPPNNIPTDGSTLGVWIDGALIGHPSYNHFRDDIAALFPGYANSNGAVGVFTLDTTAFANGVHTIAWSVVDNAGNEDGIGSRYFSILNTGSPSPQSEALSRGSLTMLSELSGYKDVSFQPIYTRRGYDRIQSPKQEFAVSGEMLRLEIRELERVEILLDEKAWSADIARRTAELAGLRPAQAGASTSRDGSRWEGYLIVGEELRLLPIGSTLDASVGIFSWLHGPGFLGDYRLVFIDRESWSRTSLAIRIIPGS